MWIIQSREFGWNQLNALIPGRQLKTCSLLLRYCSCRCRCCFCCFWLRPRLIHIHTSNCAIVVARASWYFLLDIYIYAFGSLRRTLIILLNVCGRRLRIRERVSEWVSLFTYRTSVYIRAPYAFARSLLIVVELIRVDASTCYVLIVLPIDFNCRRVLIYL